MAKSSGPKYQKHSLSPGTRVEIRQLQNRVQADVEKRHIERLKKDIYRIKDQIFKKKRKQK